MALNEEIKEGEYYRSYDKPNQKWLRHYFFTTAKCVFVNATTTLDSWITNINSAIQGIISQTDSEATNTVPSSKLFHDTVSTMQSNFQAGCKTIADAITSNGGTASASSTPAQMAAAIDGIRSPNRGALSASIGSSDHTGNSYTLQSGYYTGGNVTLNDSNLKAENIAKNVKIFNITGTYDNGSANVKGNATAAQVLQSTGANNTGTAIKFSSATAGSDVQGTMVNRGAPTSTINCGASYSISAGYYSGGTITAQTLANATSAGTITNNGTAGQTNQILNGYVAFSDGVQYTGKMPSNSNGAGTVIYNPNKATSFYAYMPWGYYPNAGSTGSYANRGYVSVSDANLTSANIKSGVTIFGVSGNSNVVDTSAGTLTNNGTAGQTNQMLNGYVAFSDGVKYTGKIGSKAAATYTPTTSDQSIAAGQYLSGAQTIKGDANLKAANIKSGVSIFGVTGSYTVSSTRDFYIYFPQFTAVTGQTVGGYGGAGSAIGQIFVRVTNNNGTLTMRVLDNTLGDTGYESWIKCTGMYMQGETVVASQESTLGGNRININAG